MAGGTHVWRNIVLVGVSVATISMGWHPNGYAKGNGRSLSIGATAYAVIDVSSGRIVAQRRADAHMRIASLTKVMTAIVALDHGAMTDMVTVSPQAARQEGSSLYMQANEKMSLHTMLYGLMLRSGNDAAMAIAEHVGGSAEGFAYMMNAKAETLGMTNSHFVNPSGLDDPSHYASALDLAILTAYGLKNPLFHEIVRTKIKRAPNPHKPWDYVWANKNKMLFRYEGADGVKTGFTKLAHRTLISSATRGQQQFAVVTLDDATDWADHTALLDDAFLRFPHVPFVEAGDLISPTTFVAQRDFAYPLTTDEWTHVQKKITIYAPHTVEYKRGYRGQLAFFFRGQFVGAVPLVPPETVNRTTPVMSQEGQSFWQGVQRLGQLLFGAKGEENR
jgi:D-alanyl-D-alanine carboxypeptidase